MQTIGYDTKFFKNRVGEMSQQLKSLAALAEDHN